MGGLHVVEINVSDLERAVRFVLYTVRAADAIGAPSRDSLFFEHPDRIKVEVITPEPK